MNNANHPSDPLIPPPPLAPRPPAPPKNKKIIQQRSLSFPNPPIPANHALVRVWDVYIPMPSIYAMYMRCIMYDDTM